MNASTEAETLALAKVDQMRLERLAALAGRSPQSLLRFVLRDGFDAVEDDIHESLGALRDIERHGTVPHAKRAHRTVLLLHCEHWAQPELSRLARCNRGRTLVPAAAESAEMRSIGEERLRSPRSA